MNLQYKEFLPADFADDSRVWIYQSQRMFGISEALSIGNMLEDFAKDWKSHGTPVKGFAKLLFGQFIIIMADETATGVSGCSTDSSVRVIKEIEKTFQVQLFDRLSLAFYIKDKIQLLPIAQLPYALDNHFVDGETLYFNNTVQTRGELVTNWIIPMKTSWLASKYLKKGAAGATAG